eukprot:CAMPEP_0176495676 /NCGR_PEP_ID=MMETSP0200_2-20121128/10787_1 /TAXON_ID=947934 /ORGANISM="Chaetoceros sp., Strain GSL56" /LENGTH=500 /DNA_ID=CAMNT_0017893577 /DNA_START=132 /DNA_END=1634 /DNA_ORIENTATION=+
MDRILPDVLSVPIARAIEKVYAYGPMADKTVILVPAFVTSHVEGLAEAIGFDVETLSYTLGMFLCYPLGMIMASLPYGKIRHLFSFLLGAFLLQFTLGKQWIHQLIAVVISYIFMLILPPKITKTVVPTFIMLYVTLGHLHRQFVNYLGWDLDFTGSHMVLAMKLYSLAYNLYDGDLIRLGKETRATQKCAHLAVTGVPGIIEFLGYTFNFSTILAGPAFEYKIYADACEGKNLFDDNGKPKGKIPSQVMPTLKPFLLSLICLVAFVVGNAKFPLLDPTDPQNFTPVIITEEFLKKPWVNRYAYSWVALFFIRMKYYFAWKNAEGASNIWYAGFEGFDKEGKPKGWENSNNVDIIDFETAPNVKTLSAAWNKKTANWLGRYVYMRTGGSLVATYGLSAFWHGFYPGYYMFFLSVPLVTMCERLGRKKLSPRFSPNKWSLYGICTIVATSLIVEYIVIAFQLLAFDWAVEAWKSHYFFGHILCILFYGIVSQLPTPKTKGA